MLFNIECDVENEEICKKCCNYCICYDEDGDEEF